MTDGLPTVKVELAYGISHPWPAGGAFEDEFLDGLAGDHRRWFADSKKLERLRSILSPARNVDAISQLTEAQVALWPNIAEFMALAAKRPAWVPSEAQRERWRRERERIAALPGP